MINIEDIRGEAIKQEENAHTAILEKLVENQQEHKTLTKVKSGARCAYDLLETVAAGYLCGYLVSDGDVNLATQFSEYAAVFWTGFKLGVELPLKKLTKNAIKIKEKETHRMEFTDLNAVSNKQAKNELENKYCANLSAARNPLKRAIRNTLYCAGTFWLASLLVDMEVNIMDFVTVNPLEKGLEGVHYLAGQIAPIKDYISLNAHEHSGDFNQMRMLGIGAASGLLQTGKEFIIGNYQRLRAKFKRN